MKETLYITALLCLGTCLYGIAGTDVNLLPRYLVTNVLLLLGVLLFYKKLKFSKPPKGVHWYDVLLFSYCAVHFISIAWAQNFAEAVFEAGKSIVLVGGYFLIRTIVSSSDELFKRHLKRINLLISGFLMCVIIYQFAHMMTNFNYPSPYHIKGFSSHKNLFSSFLMLLLPLNIIGVVKERGGFRTLFIVFTGLQVASLILLQSRAVYVGLVMAVLFFLLSNLNMLKRGLSKNAKRIALGSILILSASFGLSYFAGFLDTLKQKTDITQFAESKSAQERVVLWKNSLELIAEKPLLGHGAGNWKIHFPRTGVGELTRASYYDAFFLRPHNDYVSLFSELGILGLGLFMLIFILPITWYFKVEKGMRSFELKILIAILFGFLGVFFFDFPKERIEHQLYLALVLALIWIETKSVEKRKINFSAPLIPLLVLFVGIIVWNLFSGYQRYVGDSYVNSIFVTNEKSNWKKMKVLAKKSKNLFFTVDPISNPIDWFDGVAHFQLGESDGAEKLLKSALTAHPYNHKVLNSLGGVYNQRKDYTKAIEYYEKALALNPFYENAILNLAITYFQAENLEKAEEWINKSSKESAQKSKLIKAISKIRNQ